MATTKTITLTAATTSEASDGVPTRSDIRAELRDHTANDNVLLDELEFTNIEIDRAVTRCIQEINAINPAVYRKFNSNGSDWPVYWKPPLTTGACGYLLRYASMRYHRNSLDYSAGNMTVRDVDKAGLYTQLSNMLLEEWREWAKNTKIALNIREGYASFSGYYHV